MLQSLTIKRFPCALAQYGETLVSDRGVETTEAALAMRAHTMETLGDALRTDGVSPTQKYVAPICNSHEYGWRAAKGSSLEIFGVGEHARKNYRKSLHDMVP